jgi:chromosome segregation ATPase
MCHLIIKKGVFVEKEKNEENTVVTTENYGNLFLYIIAAIIGRDLEAEINCFKEQTIELTKENEIMKKELEDLKNSNAFFKQDHDTLFIKSELYKSEIKELIKENKNIKKKNKKLAKKNKELIKENKEIKEDKNHLLEEIEELKDVINELKQRNFELKKENEILNRLVENSRKIDVAKDGIIPDDFIIDSNLEKKSELLKDGVKDLLEDNEKMKEIVEENKELAEKTKNLELAISKIEEIVELRDNLDKLINENDQLTEENINLNKLMDDFKEIDALKTGIF